MFDRVVRMQQSELVELPASGPTPQYPIESVDNALKIIHMLGINSELRLTQVAKALGVASSTAHRLLAMLQYRGFIRQDPESKTYKPGSALSTVSYAILQRFDIREALRPVLVELNTELQETVHLSMLDGATVRFIDALESPKAVRVASRLGRSMPAHATSSGKAMLASLTEGELRGLYPAEQLAGVTEKSLSSRSALEEELRAIREHHYATSFEESEEGVGSVAVSIPSAASPARLAINVSVPVSRFDAATAARMGEELRRRVNESAKRLL